jgi:hypothetical protein
MEHIHKFNLDNYIDEYDYEKCGESSSDEDKNEHSDTEDADKTNCLDFNEVMKKDSEGGTQDNSNPYGGTLSQNS